MRLSTKLALVAALCVATPAYADGVVQNIDCANVSVLNKSIDELAKLKEVCQQEHPTEISKSLQQMRDMNDIMSAYVSSARANAAQLGITPYQYMNSLAGRAQLGWLVLKVYRNTVMASILMLLCFTFAAIAGRRITTVPLKWEQKKLFGVFPYRSVTEVHLNNDMNVAAWGTIGFAGLALLACGAIYGIML